MSDEKYTAVIEAIPSWRPTREVRTFGISAIQSIVKCTLKEAIEIRDRLEYSGGLPKLKY